MGFGATLAEMLAAKSESSAPQIEAALSKRASDEDLLRQIREHEYTQAQNNLPNGPDTGPRPNFTMEGGPQSKDFQLVGGPQGDGYPATQSMADKWNAVPTPEGGFRVPDGMQLATTPDEIKLGPTALAPTASGSMGKGLAVGAGALAAGALAYKMSQKDSPPPGASPTPASSAPDTTDDSNDDSDYDPDETPFKKLMKAMPKKGTPAATTDRAPATALASTGTSIGTDAELQAAMAQRDSNRAGFDKQRRVLDFERAAQLMGSGMSGTNYAATGGASLEAEGKELEDRAKFADQPVKDLDARIANQENDPGSASSQSVRALATKMGFNFGDNVSAADIKKQVPQMTSYINHLETVEMLKQRGQAMAENRRDKADSKATDTQNKAHLQTQTLLESARGNPAASKAENDIYNADKADSLATLYGDPNQLSMPQVKMLASEIGKIAAGGVSSQHELEGITPNTLVGKMSGYVSQLTNNPTPANAAAFVKQYQDYAGALRKDAQKVILDKYGRVINARRPQIGEDNYQLLKTNYLNRFGISDDDLDNFSKPNSGSGKPSGPTAPSSGSNPPASSQPPAADTIRLRAPDGSIRDVPAEKAASYIKKGAVRVQ
jgi:hypothetical protein